jgi:hypothetical protein
VEKSVGSGRGFVSGPLAIQAIGGHVIVTPSTSGTRATAVFSLCSDWETSRTDEREGDDETTCNPPLAR